jgi:sigma-B regulation protein RsbU (phosphoserine phosphatase)
VFEKTLEETTAFLQSGDTLVFYTDGFSEAKNEAGEEYGDERLLSALRSFAGKPTSRDVVQAICKDVQRFTGFAPQHDDMTMVVVKIL